MRVGGNRGQSTISCERASLAEKSGRLQYRGHLVERATANLAASKVLVHSAPLLEEEGHARVPALPEDRIDPLLAHGSRARTGFASNDHPVNSRKGAARAKARSAVQARGSEPRRACCIDPPCER